MVIKKCTFQKFRHYSSELTLILNIIVVFESINDQLLLELLVLIHILISLIPRF
jgi:hypothetical protein